MLSLLIVATLPVPALGQTLNDELARVPLAELVSEATVQGDAARGAVVFFHQQMACSRCHSVGDAPSALGPDLASLPAEVTDEHLVESVLFPSKVIRRGYESVTVATRDGRTLSGILVRRTAEELVLRDAARQGEETRLAAADLEDVALNAVSLMPAGQVNQLASRQQFLDLVRYLMELRTGGAARARELQPSPALLTLKVPDYEQRIDHAGFIREWNSDSLKRGEAIYRRVCMNCHGTVDEPGSLPTSLRFASGRFRNGSDPFTMYQTLTRGFGLMAAQTWMVPSQKYDVIHYIRESYLRPHNPSQYVDVSDDYLARLPPGDDRGPAPSTIHPWNAMDYGPSLTHSWEAPGPTQNIAFKGIAVRLDPGSGGVSRGRHWMMFDTDTLRMAAAWSAADPPSADQNFVDWRGIQFNGEHQIHPRLTGRVIASNDEAPGWANPETGDFVDHLRVLGRDDRRYGPLPRTWGRFRGIYHHQQDAVLSYSVGTADILERPSVEVDDGSGESPAFLRTFNLGRRDQELVLQVAQRPGGGVISASDWLSGSAVAAESTTAGGPDIFFGPLSAHPDSVADRPILFDGRTCLEIADASALEMVNSDFTVTARVRTRGEGTLFAKTEIAAGGAPLIRSLTIRDGRLNFAHGDGQSVASKRRINDGRWHEVAAVWSKETQRLQLVIDGRADPAVTLDPGMRSEGGVVRLGHAASDAPEPPSFLTGELDEVRFFQRALNDELRSRSALETATAGLVAAWRLRGEAGPVVNDLSPQGHKATVVVDEPQPDPVRPLLAGYSPSTAPLRWTSRNGRLLLTIPPGPEPLRFTIWMKAAPTGINAAAGGRTAIPGSLHPPIQRPDQDLSELTRGGPPRWAQKLTTRVVAGTERGPFAADTLASPDVNPWQAQLRFTGLDFFGDGRMAVCSWDGDVWIVDGYEEGGELVWQRIASGLYQPLGLKIVDGKIHLTCRDQLAVLHDLNADGEIDYYECLNNDHQVTEHFHEFAMGLQTDAQGNFYYAKSGRHALEAVVPHHGTLLKVSRDGERTEILATGFRAANGVCLNPDGSFVVTDQEGFWNPKNRINWVTQNPDGRPKFYGNMFGYHDVVDSSDEAMEPPLCWITNAFDRSPGELLWVDSQRWGPLNGSLLNLSYGYGKVFVAPHEAVDVPGRGRLMQGGMIELPVSAFPTGVMRGRFNPRDGQLYLCGMFAWAGSATAPGGLYRLRATGQPMHLPVELHAHPEQLRLVFTEPLDPASVAASRIQMKTWSLKRTARYGSEHYDEQELKCTTAELAADGKTVIIHAPGLRPTWCMEIRYSLRSSDGTPVEGVLHNTIHGLNPPE